MSAVRDHYTYHFKVGREIVHTGITGRSLKEREAEHKREPGWSNGYIVREGSAKTKDGALAWEAEMREKGYPTGP